MEIHLFAPVRPMALPASMPALELRRYPLWQKTGGEADATSWHKGMLPREEGARRRPEGREDAGRTGLGGAQLRPLSTKNRLWVAAITYVATWSGWLYLAFVVDVSPGGWWALVNGDIPARVRRVGGRRPENMALWRRGPQPGLSSTTPITPASTPIVEFGKRLKEAGLLPSMGSRSPTPTTTLWPSHS
jgi:transposase InsO family protein